MSDEWIDIDLDALDGEEDPAEVLFSDTWTPPPPPTAQQAASPTMSLPEEDSEQISIEMDDDDEYEDEDDEVVVPPVPAPTPVPPVPIAEEPTAPPFVPTPPPTTPTVTPESTAQEPNRETPVPPKPIPAPQEPTPEPPTPPFVPSPPPVPPAPAAEPFVPTPPVDEAPPSTVTPPLTPQPIFAQQADEEAPAVPEQPTTGQSNEGQPTTGRSDDPKKKSLLQTFMHRLKTGQLEDDDSIDISEDNDIPPATPSVSDNVPVPATPAPSEPLPIETPLASPSPTTDIPHIPVAPPADPVIVADNEAAAAPADSWLQTMIQRWKTGRLAPGGDELTVDNAADLLQFDDHAPSKLQQLKNKWQKPVTAPPTGNVATNGTANSGAVSELEALLQPLTAEEMRTYQHQSQQAAAPWLRIEKAAYRIHQEYTWATVLAMVAIAIIALLPGNHLFQVIDYLEGINTHQPTWLLDLTHNTDWATIIMYPLSIIGPLLVIVVLRDAFAYAFRALRLRSPRYALLSIAALLAAAISLASFIGYDPLLGLSFAAGWMFLNSIIQRMKFIVGKRVSL